MKIFSKLWGDIKSKKIIGCVALLIIFFFTSFFIYGKTKNKIFKDKYMSDIFVEEEGQSSNTSTSTSSESSKNSAIKIDTAQKESNKKEITVEIKGEVKNPKVYTLSDGAIINDLIDMAGGLTGEANISNINRAKILKNEDLIVVGNINNIEDTVLAEGKNSVVTGSGVSSESNTKSNKININTGSLSELMNIEGVGEKTAQKIIDYREKNGGFKVIEDIKNVDRIGDKTFEKMKDKISC